MGVLRLLGFVWVFMCGGVYSGGLMLCAVFSLNFYYADSWPLC